MIKKLAVALSFVLLLSGCSAKPDSHSTPAEIKAGPITSSVISELSFSLDGIPFTVGDPVSKVTKLGYKLIITPGGIQPFNKKYKNNFYLLFAKGKSTDTFASAKLVDLMISATEPTESGINNGKIMGTSNGSNVKVAFNNGMTTGIPFEKFKSTYGLPTDSKDISTDSVLTYYTFEGKSENDSITVSFFNNKVEDIKFMRFD